MRIKLGCKNHEVLRRAIVSDISNPIHNRCGTQEPKKDKDLLNIHTPLENILQASKHQKTEFPYPWERRERSWLALTIINFEPLSRLSTLGGTKSRQRRHSIKHLRILLPRASICHVRLILSMSRCRLQWQP